MSDFITFAKPASRDVSLAKVITVRDGIITGKKPSPNVRLHQFLEVPVHDLESLADAVTGAADIGAIAVRGKPKAPLGRRAIHDDPKKGPAGLTVVPRRWVAFDWDGVPLEWRPCPNQRWLMEVHPLYDPEACAEIALRRLPPAFRNVSCLWQVSASAGIEPGVFRLRTWHWLDHPCTGAEIKTWLAPAIKRSLVDPVTLVEAQPHYLAVTVEGGEDPCPRRFGVLRLAHDVVAVPDIQGIARRQEEQRKAKRRASEGNLARFNVRAEPDAGRAYAECRIDECIAAVRGATARHTSYKSEAARAKTICDKYGLDCQPVRQALIAAYESTLTPQEAQQRRKFSTEGILAWLEGRAA